MAQLSIDDQIHKYTSNVGFIPKISDYATCTYFRISYNGEVTDYYTDAFGSIEGELLISSGGAGGRSGDKTRSKRTGEISYTIKKGLDSPLGPSNEYTISFSDGDRTTEEIVEVTESMSGDPLDNVTQIADVMLDTMDRMGGINAWDNLTNLGKIYLVENPADYYSGAGEFYAGLAKGKDIYVSSYLFKSNWLSNIHKNNKLRDHYNYNAPDLSQTFVHELGHNIFNNYAYSSGLVLSMYFGTYNFSTGMTEWTANFFSESIGINPITTYFNPFFKIINIMVE